MRVAAANALSIVVSLCPEKSVSSIINHVGVLLQPANIWDVRLSGMLAIKAILRVCRSNLAITVAIIDMLAGQLQDEDDDVRAVITDAFSIALPVVAQERPALLPQICTFVWQALNDELRCPEKALSGVLPASVNQGKFEEAFTGAFTEPMLKLLAALYTTQESLAWAGDQAIPIEHFELLSKFTFDPRKHCRREAARSIAALCAAYSKQADRVRSDWKHRALKLSARYIFEALLLEREIDPVLGLHSALGAAWRELLNLCGQQIVAAALAPHVSGFVSMACTPIGSVSVIVACVLSRLYHRQPICDLLAVL